jgi:hypothetical protein
MASLTLNGMPVLSGVLTMPAVGAWFAELAVDATVAPTGRVALVFEGGGTWLGTAYRSGVTRDTVLVRVVGGAGGLADLVPSKAYRAATLRLPLGDLLVEVGETLSSMSSPAALSLPLAFWTRAAGTAGDALRVLANHAGATWRVLSHGTVWIGTDAWLPAAFDFDLISEDPKSGRTEFWSETPTLAPGQTFMGRRVSKVEHRVEHGRIRTTAWTGTDDDPSDDVFAALEALVRHLTAHVNYFGQYPGAVVTQALDGTLEVKLDDPAMPGLSGVPIRYGIPGVKATVAPGARVLVSFEGGSPAAPVATLWASGSVTKLTVDGTQIVLNGGALSVARVSDTVAAGPTMATWIGAVSTFINGLAPATCTPPTDFGAISSGAEKVRA